MRCAALSLTAGLLLLTQGCFLYVGVNDEEEGKHWVEDEERPWNDDDDDDPAGDDFADLDVTIEVTPGEVTAGETTILQVDIYGDATAADLFDVDLGDGIDVLDLVVRDDVQILIAIDVAADVEGEVDIILDFGDLGRVIVPAGLVVVDKLPDGSGDDGGDGTDPTRDTDTGHDDACE